MGTEIEEGEEGGERTGGKKSGGAGLGIAESKAQRRKPEASACWTGGTHLYPISYQSAFFFLFVALALIFLTLLLPI